MALLESTTVIRTERLWLSRRERKIWIKSSLLTWIPRAALEAQPLDYEKPGLAQHYCVECAKYFETDNALQSHWRSKVHKRRLKQLKEPAYTIEESEMAAGLGRENKRPLPSAASSVTPTVDMDIAVAA
ncbi:hypothetical protein CC1G_08390 [Coprinopsis cinerea okayama7|uniref:C2H2-type domain-containing protein n=1 Tax=Coprinopsis cinerea (strain Okayama-7 / 130 / ATCC MYA-4618 / FGSC 9003) TaxID=240176 RepID=A8NAM1_COPC7|nr:hypothetical protein CC1G_08390 [Coprinopsis cinerea okayama7\|eukprot:XP_001831873.2 hypothetical protein CC1G_08390 [Coprinopsis cinerea okayama7\